MSRFRLALTLVSAALFVDSLLYSVVVPVLPGYGKDLGVSTVGIGVLFAAYAVGLLGATPILGPLSDRVGRRLPLVTGSLGIAAATMLFALADSYPVLIGARLLQGIAAAAVWTAGIALLADVTPRAQLGRALGIATAAMSAGLVLGPPLGGIALEAAGRQAPFVAAAAAAALNAALQILLLREPPRHEVRPGGVRRLLSERATLATAAGVLLAAAALSMLEPVLPLDLAGRLGAGAAAIGLIFGVATLSHAATSPLAGAAADRCGSGALIGCGLVGMGTLLPVLVLTKSVVAAGATLAAFAIAFSFVIVPALRELAGVVERTGGGAYASAYALFNFAYGLGMVVGPLAGGAGASASSVSVTFAAGGALLCTGGLLLVLDHAVVTCVAPNPTPSRSESR